MVSRGDCQVEYIHALLSGSQQTSVPPLSHRNQAARATRPQDGLSFRASRHEVPIRVDLPQRPWSCQSPPWMTTARPLFADCQRSSWQLSIPLSLILRSVSESHLHTYRRSAHATILQSTLPYSRLAGPSETWLHGSPAPPEPRTTCRLQDLAHVAVTVRGGDCSTATDKWGPACVLPACPPAARPGPCVALRCLAPAKLLSSSPRAPTSLSCGGRAGHTLHTALQTSFRRVVWAHGKMGRPGRQVGQAAGRRTNGNDGGGDDEHPSFPHSPIHQSQMIGQHGRTQTGYRGEYS